MKTATIITMIILFNLSLPHSAIAQSDGQEPAPRLADGGIQTDTPATLEAGITTIYLPMVVSTKNAHLLVWYDFEGDFLATGFVADRSGNGYDAQVIEAVGAGAGISDSQAITFSGGIIQAQENPVSGRTAVTFSLWFKAEHPEENYKLASAAWWNGGPASGWIMATHVPEFWSDDTLGLYLPDQPIYDNHFAAGQWMHEAVTYDGVRIKEYTNGELINDWATTGASIGQGMPMAIGGWPPYALYNFLGSIDEFKIYDRTLSPEEIQAIYHQGSGTGNRVPFINRSKCLLYYYP